MKWEKKKGFQGGGSGVLWMARTLGCLDVALPRGHQRTMSMKESPDEARMAVVLGQLFAMKEKKP
jgi:hypothetical protein